MALELGKEPNDQVRARIARAIDGHRHWVLVGGPPCQAYSNVGRSRMKGNANFEEDPRHYLLRRISSILADHKPPVFVMENARDLSRQRYVTDLSSMTFCATCKVLKEQSMKRRTESATHCIRSQKLARKPSMQIRSHSWLKPRNMVYRRHGIAFS
ncbi:MAG: DNA cytosine methyltransferase [Chloroflexi bacterium]|nr:DNA cytosine methyltransferase [Chloroflexota bacterium]